MQKGIFNRSQYLAGNELAFVTGGAPYFTRLLQLISEAQKQIHFQVYIFDEDDTGKEVAAALKSARQRGVDIFSCGGFLWFKRPLACIHQRLEGQRNKFPVFFTPARAFLHPSTGTPPAQQSSGGRSGSCISRRHQYFR